MKNTFDIRAAIILVFVCCTVALILESILVIKPAYATMYEVAVRLYEAADYENALELFRGSGIRDSAEYIQNIIILMHGGTL